jgi:hypothetical protein
MSETETTEAFLKRIADTTLFGSEQYVKDYERLYNLARRGAAIPDEPTEAMLNAELGLRPWDNLPSYESRRDLRPYIYRAMLSTALKEST